MAKSITPPVRSCNTCGTSKSASDQPWINKDEDSPDFGMWMVGNKSTGWLASGNPGKTPYIKGGTWWIGNTDTGEPANGVVDMPSPESDTDLFY